ncbi:MAG: hypothetical protein HY731_10510 [Candidatus Tectomicrobia bacterium]|nr:hypothetical protein [Candidatus Tectomicrobia bacterium]
MPLEAFRLIQENREVVAQALREGELDDLLGTQLTVADGYVLCALREGRLSKWALEFPDPREQEEIGRES